MLITLNNNEYGSTDAVKKEVASRSELFKAHLASPIFFSDILKSKQNGEVRDDFRI